MKSLYCLALISLLLFPACSGEGTSTSASPIANSWATYSPEPDEYISSDMFVHEGLVCLKMVESGWWEDVKKLEQIGSIQRSGVQDDWRDFDATILEVGTPIYSTDDAIVFFIELEGEIFYYLKLIEG